jgi:hypothetical protein
MRFNIEIDWALVLRKVRIFFLLGVFYALYTYVAPVWAFMWIAYFILNDISDMESDLDDLNTRQEERDKEWKNILPKRKGF